MEILLPILAIAAIAASAMLVSAVVRSSFQGHRARVEREARRARRKQPVARPLLP